MFRNTILVIVFAASSLLVEAAFAKADKSLSPTPMQSSTTKDIVKMLSSRHYKKMAFDDSLSVAFLERYIKALDPARMFFLTSDIQSFQRHSKQFDDDFKAGRLEEGFKIYRQFQKRMVSRLKYVIALLENKDTTFDFSINEFYEIDRENAQWPKTDKEADELWRKRTKLNVLNQKLSGTEPAKSIDSLIKRYKNQLNRIQQQSNVDIYEALINALTVLFDPHTNYLSPRTSENFNISMSLSLEGIGAVLKTEDENTRVVRLVVGGPAHKAGQLKPADNIVGVGQGQKGELVDVVGWRLDEVVDLIRGKKNTTVRLELLRDDDSTSVISIKRDKVKLEDQAAKKEVLEVKQNQKTHKIGIIDIPAFYIDFKAAREGNPNYKSTTRDVKRLVQELVREGVSGIVLDLRNNGGGSLQEATQLTDLFIDQGPVVQIRQSDGRVNRQNRAYSRALYHGPLVVMINRLSASASEIFAGAIQDYKRGVIVGTQSFGKGTVQLLSRMPEGELKLTESKFYRVSGDSTQHRGVIPDIRFPTVVDKDDVGESKYETALPWDQIHPANHIQYFNISSIISGLEKKHKERAAVNPDYQNLIERIALANENKDKKFISLQEKTRIKEKVDIENKSLSLENKLRKNKGKTLYKNYEELKKAREEEAEKNEAAGSTTQIDLENDALLIEASNILVDFSKLIYQKKSKQVAKQNQSEKSVP